MGLSAGTLQNVDTWTDLSGFNALRQTAQTDSKAALPVVARQFEAIFTQMMLKSMREAGMGDGIFDSQAGDAWRDMYDQQLAVTLSAHGRGLGIAQMLERQLGGSTGASGSGKTAAGEGVAAGIAGADAAPVAADDWRQRLGSVLDATRAVGRRVMRWLPQDAKEFVRELAPYAESAARKLGVSMRAVLAQAALETQWGQRMPVQADGASSNNMFGMKASSDWDGGRVSVPTLEFEGGVAVRRQAQFRAYESPAASFSDYARLIGDNPRYAAARNHGDDVAAFARGLVQGGYATDPGYASKLDAIANSPLMRQALAALKKADPTPTL
ncbi:flagellar assembly peptidoglycan hydrolase FlgJ [Dyella sp. A6]|uniref:flagellar assembly peptidoglycan hydrolase FlgJ n=1 Tax=Dyella aluminiiresistens TaxID=3069105 RepID=UPI002E79D87C|nr:flagellar assembly peptidoglycan hydrolase FlgJ [Dyella sp. A6]